MILDLIKIFRNKQGIFYLKIKEFLIKIKDIKFHEYIYNYKYYK